MSDFDYEVAIVGAGPAGIGAATALGKAGISNIAVFEREPEAGGIPRHIHHLTFGLLVYRRPMSGLKFIAKILANCPDVTFEFHASVTAIKSDGIIELATPTGRKTVHARHVILATGAREKPRHPRLTSGLRPQGIMTTGALQKCIYGAGLVPFKRPVIVGTELVSFSALATLRSGGAKAVAMIEENPRITTYRPAIVFGALMDTPIHYNSRIVDIGGVERVEYIVLENQDKTTRTIECDGIIFSGNFVGETAITYGSHLITNPLTQLSLVDQNWVSSDSNISIIGNCAHPADMGDQCYLEGLEAGQHVANLLSNGDSEQKGTLIPIAHDPRIKMITPGAIRITKQPEIEVNFHLHVLAPYWGNISVLLDGETIYSKRHRCQPARRITLKGVKLGRMGQAKSQASSMPKVEVILDATN